MKILSIDWDYFQTVTTEIVRNCYPDGIDLGTSLSEIIWASKYAFCKEISDVGINMTEYNNLRNLLKQQNENTPVMIAQSHVDIYDFIKSHMADRKTNSQTELVNIDMHHDILNDNEKLDCGNWIKHLIEDKTLSSPLKSLKWIHNPISFELYGLNETDQNPEGFEEMIRQIDGGTSIGTIINEKYDIIFLARSDIWSTPALDFYFNNLKNEMTEHFKEVRIDKDVKRVRQLNFNEITEMIKKLEKR